MRSSFMKDLRQRDKDKERLKPKKAEKRAKNNKAMIFARRFMTTVYEALTSFISLEKSAIKVYLKGPNVMRIGIGGEQNITLIDNAFYLSLNRDDYTKANIHFSFKLSKDTLNFIEQHEQTEHKHCIQLSEDVYNYSSGTEYKSLSIKLQDIQVIIENGTLMSLMVYLFEDVSKVYEKLKAEIDERSKIQVQMLKRRPLNNVNMFVKSGTGKSSYALTQMARMQTRELILLEGESSQFLNPPVLNFR